MPVPRRSSHMELVIIIFGGDDSPRATVSEVTFLKRAIRALGNLGWTKQLKQPTGNSALGGPCLCAPDLRDDHSELGCSASLCTQRSTCWLGGPGPGRTTKTWPDGTCWQSSSANHHNHTRWTRWERWSFRHCKSSARFRCSCELPFWVQWGIYRYTGIPPNCMNRTHHHNFLRQIHLFTDILH